ncbi:hypothetical protein BC834DRAFT_127035 [Gloeopeniophorella convolvens]|nr:hypothetical protein BC834DRAFT_127035 [Gloeopeniophorella convolvens]
MGLLLTAYRTICELTFLLLDCATTLAIRLATRVDWLKLRWLVYFPSHPIYMYTYSRAPIIAPSKN